MADRKGKLPIQNGPKVERAISVVSPQRAVIATENPIQRWDEQTQQVVNEVLLMDGIVWRGGRDQIPIVDSHNDKTVRNIFGSIQHMRVDESNGELYGVPVFASDAESQTIMQRMAEGHITDFSITGQPIETLFVSRGQSYTTTRGAVIDGPALIHTKWQPQNASICATGADEQSTVRRSYTDLNRKVIRMNPELLAKLSSMGLPDGVTDPDQVLAWVIGKVGEGKEAMPEVKNMAEEEVVPEVKPEIEKMADEKPAESMAEEKKPEDEVARQAPTVDAIKRALDRDQKRRNEIQAAVTIARLDRAFADELCNSGVSVADANKRIIERMATQPLGSSVGADVKVTASEDDKFLAAAKDGLVQRAYRSASIKRTPFDATNKPAEGAEDFAKQSLTRLAHAFVRRMGGPVDRMSNRELAMAALGHRQTIERYRIERSEGAYHTTGSFANLMLSAANKTLIAAYEEAPYTWSLWARQASSVEDFKSVHRMRFSESPDLDMVPETKPYPEKPMTDSKESYKVEKYGALFTVSWETVVNDDLDAISRVPAMHGNAARRVQNKKVYEVLTSNPLMSDGENLFDADHASGSNVSGAAAAPSVTTLNAAFVKMMTQKGLNSSAIINVQPKFLIVPVNYGATALELLGSMANPAAGGSAAGNSNTLNIYGPNGSRGIVPIIEPQLDAASSTVWYMAADPGQVDTVELAFLSGEETPTLESEWDYKTDTYVYKIRQTFGVKAIDWRGLYRNAA